jgi:hypothetical protein
VHSAFAVWFVVSSVSHALGSAPQPAGAAAYERHGHGRHEIGVFRLRK